ncbi:MAG: DUF4331 domain-containing protein [Acidobacteriota bacterium]
MFTLILILALLCALPLAASSHREAPAILGSPQVDGTDFYMFRSYEPGREGFVTLIANYNPLQDPYGGPNYFPLDSDAFYDIHISNDGDAVEDITFRFKFTQNLAGISLSVGEGANTADVAVPLANVGPFGIGLGIDGLNYRRSYTLRVVRGDLSASPTTAFATQTNGTPRFGVPFDNVGTKSAPNYAAYANLFVSDVVIPGCANGRVFVGQRAESFAVNLGEVFDLVNFNPLGAEDGETSDTADKNITSLALEVPIDCLTGTSDVIAGWTTARLPRSRDLVDNPTFEKPNESFGDFVQVSRLANPLVNEVAIGLPDKNLFNNSQPRNDGQFLTYVTNPTLPELLQILFGVEAPNNFPRNDLVQVFLTGVEGLNDDGSVGEMMRLNTAIDATPRDEQSHLGVAGGDLAGYPNGRRPGDDTVDISLRAVMGVLCHLGVGCTPEDAPDGLLPYTDGAIQNAAQFDNAFPYLTTPYPGAPQD